MSMDEKRVRELVALLRTCAIEPAWMAADALEELLADAAVARSECEAMRIPTDAMIEAGCDAFLARNEDRFAIFADDIRAVWKAMYDAAIARKGKTT